MTMIVDFKKDMMKRYEKNDMGLRHHFLGIEIYQKDHGIFICEMNDCKSYATPLVVNEKFVKEDGEKATNATLYRNLVENLLYFTATRTNIMYVCFKFII